MLKNPVEYFWSLWLVLHVLYHIPEATPRLRSSKARTYQPSHQWKLFLHCKPWCACARRHSEGTSLPPNGFGLEKNNSPSYNPTTGSSVRCHSLSLVPCPWCVELKVKVKLCHHICAALTRFPSKTPAEKSVGFFSSSAMSWFWIQLYSIPTAGMPAALRCLSGNPVHLP